jgi:hypothetical protein
LLSDCNTQLLNFRALRSKNGPLMSDICTDGGTFGEQHRQA